MLKNKRMPIGREVPADAAPPGPDTQRFAAGVVTFGVEYRYVRASDYPQDSVNAAVGAWGQIPIEEDSGPAIYVFDSVTGAEYLRFDCLAMEPHYHYESPAESTYWIVPFDLYANGTDMVGWTINALQMNLRPMLRNTGGAHLIDSIDDGLVERATALVRAAVNDVVQRALVNN